MNQNPPTDEQLNEIAETHPGDWYSGEWRSQYVDSTTDEMAHYVVTHQQSGTVLAELPDWAGPIALFIADAHDAVPVLLAEVRRLRATMEEIRHLHKDSPMGPCPVCIDADAAAAGGDGLVSYPCPTARLAGAQDCDPPHMRAARYEAAGDVMAASLVRDGFGDDEIAEILNGPRKASGPQTTPAPAVSGGEPVGAPGEQTEISARGWTA